MKYLKGFSIVEGVIGLLILTIVWIVSTEMIIQSKKLSVSNQFDCTNSIRNELIEEKEKLENGETISICEKMYFLKVDENGSYKKISLCKDSQLTDVAFEFIMYNHEG